MAEKFLNKYRISSTRLRNWDYGSNGTYFITICSNKRGHYFGKIIDGVMHLSDIGEIAQSEWLKTPDIRTDMNLELGEFVVMPNHFHGIIIIGENIYNSELFTELGMHHTDAMHHRTDAMHHRSDAMHRVSDNPPKNQFGKQSKNLASIIRGFKSSITTQARIIGISDFAWQPRYHDHIIRNLESFERIQNYIANNPFKWKEDKFHK